MSSIIQVQNLFKTYDKKNTVVKDLTFDVKDGDFFAFLGPNGAGKSTTINCVCTVLDFERGEITVGGYKVKKQDRDIRRLIGITFQNSVLDNLLTVRENLESRSRLYSLSRQAFQSGIDRLADLIDIKDILNMRYGKLSGGQKRRADIARALIHNPRILVLDEPTSGLDPQSRMKVWQTVKTLRKELGLTVFLTTHYMEEAEKANDCVIIDRGVIAAHGTPEALKNRYSKNKLKIEPKNLAALSALLEKDAVKFRVKNDEIEIRLDTTLDAPALINKYRDGINSFEVLKSSMDSVFLEITGYDIR